MDFRSGIKAGVKLGERPALDEHVEGPAAEMTAEPEMRKQGLGDDEMAGFRIEFACVVFREAALGFEQETLADGSLRREPALMP